MQRWMYSVRLFCLVKPRCLVVRYMCVVKCEGNGDAIPSFAAIQHISASCLSSPLGPRQRVNAIDASAFITKRERSAGSCGRCRVLLTLLFASSSPNQDLLVTQYHYTLPALNSPSTVGINSNSCPHYALSRFSISSPIPCCPVEGIQDGHFPYSKNIHPLLSTQESSHHRST